LTQQGQLFKISSRRSLGFYIGRVTCYQASS
jgi:hypothetical protein